MVVLNGRKCERYLATPCADRMRLVQQAQLAANKLTVSMIKSDTVMPQQEVLRLQNKATTHGSTKCQEKFQEMNRKRLMVKAAAMLCPTPQPSISYYI